MTATDEDDANASDTFTLTVNNVNDAPVIEGDETVTLTVNEDEGGTLSLSAGDDDGDTLTWDVSAPRGPRPGERERAGRGELRTQ